MYLNLSGNPGMATAGSGDVLSGIIGSLLAQGMKPEEAAPLGVSIHGLAGDTAKERCGERGLLASDIIQGVRELKL
jgi:NAD(P)H-hydrate epimerase